jgi:hypothetical protein
VGKIDEAGRTIAGLLTYNPGPGIYSRLERAIEQMPETVRTQELPGLLKRYKDGVPGWELKATDLDEVIAGRDVVPRSELLARVKERSPVYTHKEVVLGGDPPQQGAWHYDEFGPDGSVVTPGGVRTGPVYQDAPSPLGQGVSHGQPRFGRFSQGGSEYTERLLLDPANPAAALPRPHHFHRDYPNAGSPLPLNASREITDAASGGTVGHLRYDRHGDALRLNELQSDLHNYNIKSAKAGGEQLPFVGSDATRELLIKQFLLDAARKGAAVEIASPKAISEAVNMPLDHAQHLYGKVYPSDLERMGRKLGGLTRVDGPEFVPGGYEPARGALTQRIDDLHTEAFRAAEAAAGVTGNPNSLLGELYQFDAAMERIVGGLRDGRHSYLGAGSGGLSARQAGQELYDDIFSAATTRVGLPRDRAQAMAAGAMPSIMRLAEEIAAAEDALEALRPIAKERFPVAPPVGYRAVMSDEMRRRIIQQGIGASVLAPLLMQEE